jgi:hypothetical protein
LFTAFLGTFWNAVPPEHLEMGDLVMTGKRSKRGYPLMSAEDREWMSFHQRIWAWHRAAAKAGDPVTELLPSNIQHILDNWDDRTPERRALLEEYIEELKARSAEFRSARKSAQRDVQREQLKTKRRKASRRGWGSRPGPQDG